MNSSNTQNNEFENSKLNSIQNKLKELTKKKWVLIGLGIFILMLVSLPLLLSQKQPQENNPNNPIINMNNTKIVNVTPIVAQSEFTAEQKKAIETQQKSDMIVAIKERDIKTDFPWFIKLPLRAEKYFVYFDTETKIFTGLLYPKAGDSTEQMKIEINTKLKDTLKVPVENFKFEWKVIPE